MKFHFLILWLFWSVLDGYTRFSVCYIHGGPNCAVWENGRLFCVARKRFICVVL